MNPNAIEFLVGGRTFRGSPLGLWSRLLFHSLHLRYKHPILLLGDDFIAFDAIRVVRQSETTGMNRATTREVQVTVEPSYLPDHSNPEAGHHVWAYQIEILNMSNETIQLLNRYWQITDAYGRVEEVRGPGVVGEQPVIEPGDSFSYTSGCPLDAPSGIMVGSYQMVTRAGELFTVDIPAFSLDIPGETRTLN